MPNALFPRTIDNVFRGPTLALWVLWPALLLKLTQSVVVLWSPAWTARGADGFPLETYPAAAAGTIVALFARAAVSRMLLGLLCLLALVRYRGMVALAFALLALEQVGTMLVFRYYPPERVGSPVGPTVNIWILAAMVAGVALSLVPRRAGAERAATA